MTEGVIASWSKKVGDTVKSGDVLAEVETDKATMELESYNDGTLLYIGVQEKESVAVDGVIAVIGKPGEDFQALLSGNSGGAVVQKEAAHSEVKPAAAAPVVSPATPPAAAPSKSVNATAILMPKMSDTMTEGTIVSWQKQVGDKVKSGELLAEVETDKATMELESYEDGTLLYIGVKAGESVQVDGIIAIIGEAGADYNVLLNGGTTATVATTEATDTSVSKTVVDSVSTTTQASASTLADGHVKASPLARKLAEDKGIKLDLVPGSGENGRIVKRDIEGYKPAAAAPAKAEAPAKGTASPSAPRPASAVGVESYEDVPLTQMRKTIARRLGESLFTAPHFYLTMEINMDKAIEARKSINDFAASKVSFNDLVIKAAAAALKQNPKVNSSWLGDRIRYNHHVHIGVAVAVEEGLLVPVVRFADSLSLTNISSTVKDLGARAKNKQLQPADWEGSTFTISNLGMFGIDEFTAIINPPDACILAVGGIKETVIVRNGSFVASNIMKVTLSCDHRVVDGAVGSAFLQTLKALLEDPIRLLA